MTRQGACVTVWANAPRRDLIGVSVQLWKWNGSERERRESIHVLLIFNRHSGEGSRRVSIQIGENAARSTAEPHTRMLQSQAVA